MIIDYISAEKLPWIIVWLDWNFYAYRPSFIASILLVAVYYWFSTQHHYIGDMPILFLVGFCLWVTWCFVMHGLAVG